MKHRHLFGKTGALIAGLLLCFGMTVMAAPSVEGDTELTAVEGEIVSAEYVITSDEDMESVTLTLAYDKEVLTYNSGSGGNNFSGSGGNGNVQLSSKPGETEATFAVKFKGNEDAETTVEITACTVVIDGEEFDALTGESLAEEEGEAEEGEEEEDEERASFVIDERTFYVRRPDSFEDFDTIKMDIQGIESRVLKHNELDLYVVKLRSDNGSYRDHFVYNPETESVIPFVQKKSGIDDVIFIEPEENAHVPTRYIPVDIGWGAKYTIPGLKHVTIDGVDQILDDSNVYLVYGINQDGEKAWYSYDYDKDSLQLFDDVAYQGEQNYILSLEEGIEGQKSESAHLLERYNTNMGRRLTVIMILVVLIVVLGNVVVMQYLKIKKLTGSQDDEDEDDEDDEEVLEAGAYITGALEENETDFDEPEEDDEIELEIIDLDDTEEDE